jgi:DNA-binding response OmpR family regulator
VKVLICSDIPALRDGLRQALSAAGHEVACDATPAALAPAAATAGALIVDPGRAKRSLAQLRDLGFAGRALLASAESQEELAQHAKQAGADGALSLTPSTDLARRFALAVGGSRRVLILEASEQVAVLVKAEVEKGGYLVDSVRDVASATSLILHRDTRPDLLMVDAKLPGVSGVSFCRFLKTNDRFSGVKVVLYGEASKPELEKLAQECGADSVVTRKELIGELAAKPG